MPGQQVFVLTQITPSRRLITGINLAQYEIYPRNEAIGETGSASDDHFSVLLKEVGVNMIEFTAPQRETTRLNRFMNSNRQIHQSSNSPRRIFSLH